MKLKTVEVNGATYAEVAEGRPVYLQDDGKETPFDAPSAVGKIRALNAEAQNHREAKERAEAALKGFEGIDSADDARKALETVRNLSSGDLVKADKVEELKASLKKTFDEQYAASNKQSQQRIAELEGHLKDVTGRYNGEKISNAFAGSKFIREKIALPLDVMQKVFADQFKIEDGKLIGYHAGGGPIMNLHGEHAGFDEAMEQIVAAYPNRDAIMKGTGSSGSGAQPSRGGVGGAGKTMTKAAFDALPLPEQARLMCGKDRPAIVE